MSKEGKQKLKKYPPKKSKKQKNKHKKIIILQKWKKKSWLLVKKISTKICLMNENIQLSIQMNWYVNFFDSYSSYIIFLDHDK